MYVLNFYSPVFVDQLKRGRKTATIRLGDKAAKYRKGEVVLITVGFQHAPREKIFEAVIDAVEVKQVRDLSPSWLAVDRDLTSVAKGDPATTHEGADFGYKREVDGPEGGRGTGRRDRR